jgi:hypothetical protein
MPLPGLTRPQSRAAGRMVIVVAADNPVLIGEAELEQKRAPAL